MQQRRAIGYLGGGNFHPNAIYETGLAGPAPAYEGSDLVAMALTDPEKKVVMGKVIGDMELYTFLSMVLGAGSGIGSILLAEKSDKLNKYSYYIGGATGVVVLAGGTLVSYMWRKSVHKKKLEAGEYEVEVVEAGMR